jgi:predicted amidohydrolase
MLIAVAQMISTNIVKDNLERCIQLISQASKKGAQALFLPEASDYIAENSEQSCILIVTTSEFSSITARIFRSRN